MRPLIVVFCLLLQISVFANMASPIRPGTQWGRPFINQYVDVVQEDLLITIDEQFAFTSVVVRYRIQANKAGIRIPFLFYAYDFSEGFSIQFDGQAVDLNPVPDQYLVPDENKFWDFDYFFDSTSFNEGKRVEFKESATHGINLELRDMKFFEVDISEGEHVVEVRYRASNWLDKSNWIQDYSFRYALSPARYWKSFGTLNVVVDGRATKHPLSSNLGEPSSGRIDSVATWKFKSLPVDVLQVNLKPEVSWLAKTLLWVGPLGLALIYLFILGFIHFAFLIKFKRKQPGKKPPWYYNALAILIPVLFIFSWIVNFGLIDSVIGPAASQNHGYTILIVVFTPIALFVYLLLFAFLRRS